MSISHISTMTSPIVTLLNTYHVPNLNFNLASIGELCDLGLTVTFSSNGCQVQYPHMGKIVDMVCKVGRLFELTSLRLLASPPISTSIINSTIYQ